MLQAGVEVFQVLGVGSHSITTGTGIRRPRLDTEKRMTLKLDMTSAKLPLQIKFPTHSHLIFCWLWPVCYPHPHRAGQVIGVWSCYVVSLDERKAVVKVLIDSL